jgi:hypothetical protein
MSAGTHVQCRQKVRVSELRIIAIDGICRREPASYDGALRHLWDVVDDGVQRAAETPKFLAGRVAIRVVFPA